MEGGDQGFEGFTYGDANMTTAGWIFMIGSLSFVVGLTYFCFQRVLAKPSAANHMHSPVDIDTHDANT